MKGISLMIVTAFLAAACCAAFAAGPAGVGDAFLWLKADDGAKNNYNTDQSGYFDWLNPGSTPAQDGDLVRSWVDQSGNGNFFGQLYEIMSPKFIAHVPELWDLPAVKFMTNSASGYTFGSALQRGDIGVPYFDMGGTQNAAGFMVLMADPSNNGGSAWKFGGAGGGQTNWFGNSDNPYGYDWIFDDFGVDSRVQIQYGGTPRSLRPYIYDVAVSPGEKTTRIDGAVICTNSGLGNGWEPLPTLGAGYDGSQSWHGWIAEVIIYKRALSDAERAAVGAYLANKYVLNTAYNVGTEPAAAPEFSPAAGSYQQGVSVTITCATPDAKMRYTTDGSNPTMSHGTIYTGPITVAATTLIKAMAWAPNHNASAISHSLYLIGSAPVAGMKLWLKADAGTMKNVNKTTGGAVDWDNPGDSAAAEGDYVHSWNDMSGNDNFFGQLYDALSPNFAPGVPQLNGMPGLKFITKTTQGYTFGSEMQRGDSISGPVKFDMGGTQNATGFMVLMADPSNNSGSAWKFGAAGDASDRQNWFGNSDNIYGYDWIFDDFGVNTRVQIQYGATPESMIPYIYDVTVNPGTKTTRINSVEVNTTSGLVNGWDTLPTLGANYYGSQAWHGWISEVIIYDHTLTNTERAAVEGYLGTKYNIALRIYVKSPISDTKRRSDGNSVESSGIVTAAFTDYFYIETANRTSGIRVDKAGYVPTLGQTVKAKGVVGTLDGTNGKLDTGERYINADSVVSTADPINVLKPLGMANKSLGGSEVGFPPAGQIGVSQGFGLNNIGLFIKTTGSVSGASGNTFNLDDGSGVPLKVESTNGLPTTSYVSVVGVSSCEKVGANVQRLLKGAWTAISP